MGEIEYALEHWNDDESVGCNLTDERPLGHERMELRVFAMGGRVNADIVLPVDKELALQLAEALTQWASSS